MFAGIREVKIFSGRDSKNFAESICDNLGVPLSNVKTKRFADGEIAVSIEESVRGTDVYVVQPTCKPANEHLMELLIMVDALKRASAYNVNLVIPYFGYARQDRKTKAREPITAKLVANLLEKAGASRVITADLHAGQIQGFFDIPLDHLMGGPLLASYFRKKLSKEIKDDLLTVVSPDIGGVARARTFSGHIGRADLAIVDKRRSHEVANVCEVMDIIGDIKGKTCILVDDIIDTAGTIVKAAAALKERGADKVYACATHGVLSDPAIDRLKGSDIEEVVLTDTIPIPSEKKIDKIKVMSIAPLFAEALRRIHSEHSVSTLFADSEKKETK
ncbi:ribose-phosphate diphosphokinase [Synergistes jonesii]|uniref:ribose-phosphate diphosphokinase n=1 Tax=Synergistes jonesii TaxID=2754 RepID=UPI002432EAE6|nr:ribose-phosphate pyrophosphokinase [Synergistes jonesii]